MRSRKTMLNIGRISFVGLTALALLGITSASATAAPAIDKETGSLTIHNYEQPVEWGPDHDGLPLDPEITVDYVPLPGVVFEVTKVDGVDFSTNIGWATADGLIEDFNALSESERVLWEPVAQGVSLGNSVEGTTDEDGLLEFPLDIGLYYVTEKAAPEIEGKVVTKALPFLVTIPITDPVTRDAWVYDVHVYPKQIVSGIEKEVIDIDAFVSGDNIDFKFYSDIPGGQPTVKYVITDQFDEKLDYVLGSERVLFGKEPGIAEEDYELTYEDRLLTITLTEAGREKAFAALLADNTARVGVTVTATVLEGANGCIPNKVSLGFENVPGHETDVESNEVTSCWGGLKIFKHVAGQESKPLSGATFEIYASHEDDFASAKKIAIGEEDSWTTGSDGTLVITGLRYSNAANGSNPAPVNAVNYYWVKEIAAPDGYLALDKPIPFAVETLVENAPVLNVPNTLEENLVKTGANGVLMIAVAGVIAGLSGLGIYRLSRKDA